MPVCKRFELVLTLVKNQPPWMSPRNMNAKRSSQMGRPMTPTKDSPNMQTTPKSVRMSSPGRFTQSPNWTSGSLRMMKSPRVSPPRSGRRRDGVVTDLSSPKRSKSKSKSQYDRFITNSSQLASSQYQLSRKDSNVAPTQSSQTSLPMMEHTMTLNLTAMGLGMSIDSMGTPVSSQYQIPGSGGSTGYIDPSQLAYQEEVARACGITLDKRILSYDHSQDNLEKNLTGRLSRNSTRTGILSGTKRRINSQPERVLDAPGMVDDFYLNLMDWSADNLLAVVLSRTIYIWNGDNGNVSEFATLQEDITSVQFSGDGSYLSIGTNSGNIEVWDVRGMRKIRVMRGHQCRVGTLSWKDWHVSSGCRDGSIINHDVRVPENRVNLLVGHASEVTGLTWRPGKELMLASGGNDNLVNIWDMRNCSMPRFTKTEHQAAVRALSWCPWQTSLLATGGGTQDRHIFFWNVNTGSQVGAIDTGSQVTRLHWSKDYKEILSTHGFPDNQMSLWNYPSCSKIVDFAGHDARVLHTGMSPDGVTIASAAGDECLKFWTVWEKKQEKTSTELSVFDSKMRLIR